MKRKSILFAFVLLVGIMMSTTVQAKNLCVEGTGDYVNKNGVQLTEKEFQFVNEFYGDTFFENMTQEDYDWLKPLNINDGNVEIKSVTKYNEINPLSSEVGTALEKITIAKNCPGTCSVYVNAQWYANPVYRSYDVIGARLVGTSLSSDMILSKSNSTSGSQYSERLKVLSNGFGASVKLPTTGMNISVDQRFDVYEGGTVYASYQHATKNVTLNASQMFTIGVGYGGVFNFYGDAKGAYDGMVGVDIAV